MCTSLRTMLLGRAVLQHSTVRMETMPCRCAHCGCQCVRETKIKAPSNNSREISCTPLCCRKHADSRLKHFTASQVSGRLCHCSDYCVSATMQMSFVAWYRHVFALTWVVNSHILAAARTQMDRALSSDSRIPAFQFQVFRLVVFGAILTGCIASGSACRSRSSCDVLP